MNDRAKAILDFWFDDMVVEKRFKRDDNFDQLIRDKFKDDHEILSNPLGPTCGLHTFWDKHVLSPQETFFESCLSRKMPQKRIDEILWVPTSESGLISF